MDFNAMLERQRSLGGVKIYNKRDEYHGDIPKDAIYCGRPRGMFIIECFGNPFVVGKDGAQGECCDRFNTWLDTGESFGNKDATEARRQWILKHIHELKGKGLVCWCWPKRCHTETLARRANGG